MASWDASSSDKQLDAARDAEHARANRAELDGDRERTTPRPGPTGPRTKRTADTLREQLQQAQDAHETLRRA